jgi:hypothetical protein
VSIPEIPGYLGNPTQSSLADSWARPDGSFPDELWPVDVLRSITPDPTGWLIVSEHYFTNDRHGGRDCVLIHPDDAQAALADTGWSGRDLGDASVWISGEDRGFESGLAVTERDARLEFFVQARTPVGATTPVVDVSLPFLWYWDAFPVSEGWRYLNHAGREHELLRWRVSRDRWEVEVRALEFRQFLTTCGRDAICQIDCVPKTLVDEFERVDDDFACDWAHFDFVATTEPSLSERPGFARLLGQYIVRGKRTDRVPRFEERRQDRNYPSFIYKVDAGTGQMLRHTCDPKALGTYFDEDNSRLHFLTPVYFKREVLLPYAAEPNRYRMSRFRLECLSLWGLDMSFSTQGLVEVYLGDLGERLPSDEWGHWLSYNVPPEGWMEEGRFRRDFLNQFVSSPDVPGDVRRARVRAAEVSDRILAGPIWRKLEGDVEAEWESMIGPLSDDTTALGPSLLLLAKALVDAMDPVPLKAFLGDADPNELSLKLLGRFAERIGGGDALVEPLRALQDFRSRGGVAHLAGSGRRTALARLGIEGMNTLPAFDLVAERLARCMSDLADLMHEIEFDGGPT